MKESSAKNEEINYNLRNIFILKKMEKKSIILLFLNIKALLSI